MTATEVRAMYDRMAATFAGAVRSFTVVIDNVTTYSGSGILGNDSTMRHLFAGGPGQRSTASLIFRADLLLDTEDQAVAAEGLADQLTGLICMIGTKEYRVMSAGMTPEGALVRIALDCPEQVGL